MSDKKLMKLVDRLNENDYHYHIKKEIHFKLLSPEECESCKRSIPP